MVEKTIFEKILQKEIPSEILFEDDVCAIIRDIHPQAPVHVLIIPKKVIPRISEAKEEEGAILGHLLLTAKQFAEQEHLAGFRLVINNGAIAGETVPHLHVHLLSGRPMAWPPG